MNRPVRLMLTTMAVVTMTLSLAAVPILAGESTAGNRAVTPLTGLIAAKKGGDPYLAADVRVKTAATIAGAGSTFAAPLQNAAQVQFASYNSSKIFFQGYQAIGSGAGETDILKRLVNWGGTDVPMNQATINNDEPSGAHYLLKQFLQVPIGLGGVAIPYNIPTLKAHTTITLNATVLARIYQGKITKWNNKAIRRLNPKINLPDKKIIVVARGDSSGTTYIFTNFLHAAAHSVWPAQPSKTPLALPAGGIAGTGNAGVAADVENTKYSIGYVEYSYVLLNSNLLKGVAAIVNKAGVALKPTLKGIAADAAQKPNVLATNFSIVYQRGRKSYPIAGYTWAVIWALNPTNNAQGVLLVKYLDWLSHSGTVNGKISGQNIAAFEGYVPLPANIQALATRTLVLAKSKRVFQGGKWHKVRLLTTTNSYEVLK